MRLYNQLRFTLIAGLIFTNPAQADYADGARAYDGGDYATAFTEWHRLAKEGDPAAQVSIASLYRGGIGRRVDLVQAAYWYSRAAEQGDAVAQMNLGEMYQHGWGVKRDPVMAYRWYDRAAVQG
ncbi:MAG: sel1 repeat family protein, partial [Rhodospirillaceae bacterium]|nr:sel1 repeat family protein [Rhodospirillaceae bacterium]